MKKKQKRQSTKSNVNATNYFVFQKMQEMNKQLRCDQCGNKWTLEDKHFTKTQTVGNDGKRLEVYYFSCPNCHTKYIYFISNKEIDKRCEKLRNLEKWLKKNQKSKEVPIQKKWYTEYKKYKNLKERVFQSIKKLADTYQDILE